LKNSFQEISPTKFVRKLLNVRSPQALKSAEITGSLALYLNLAHWAGWLRNGKIPAQTKLGRGALEDSGN